MQDLYGNYPPEIMRMPESKRADMWMALGERGTSSMTIWAVMRGVIEYRFLFTGNYYFSHPRDPDDFRRCYLLLRLIPEWRYRLNEVAEILPEWKSLVENWDELTELYENERENADGNAPLLYARMKELSEIVRKYFG